MSADDSISGAGLTAKELLTEVRSDVKLIGANITILMGQNLDRRLADLEKWREKTAIEAAQMVSDPMATPVGRSLESGRQANAKRINRLERTVWMANGACAALVIIVQVAPFLSHLVTGR